MDESNGKKLDTSGWFVCRNGVLKRNVSSYALRRGSGEKKRRTADVNSKLGGVEGLTRGLRGLDLGQPIVDPKRMCKAFQLLRKRLREAGADVAEVHLVADGARDRRKIGDGVCHEGGAISVTSRVALGGRCEEWSETSADDAGE